MEVKSWVKGYDLEQVMTVAPFGSTQSFHKRSTRFDGVLKLFNASFSRVSSPP